MWAYCRICDYSCFKAEVTIHFNSSAHLQIKDLLAAALASQYAVFALPPSCGHLCNYSPTGIHHLVQTSNHMKTDQHNQTLQDRLLNIRDGDLASNGLEWKVDMYEGKLWMERQKGQWVNGATDVGGPRDRRPLNE